MFSLKFEILTFIVKILYFYERNHSQGLKPSRKVALFGSLGHLTWFWPFVPQISSNFGQNWPILTLLSQNFKFLWKNYTQGFKPRGKVALFGPLGHLIWFWPFWTKFHPILAKIDQFWPCKIKISNFYDKIILRALNHVEKWPCLAL